MMVTYIAANGNSGRLQKIAFKEAPVGRVAATQPHNVSYTFDDAGNPTKGVVDTGTTTIYSSNHRNQYDSVGTDSVSNGNFHEMKSYQAITYCYINDALFDKVTDVRGNNYTLTYDAPPGQTPILEYYRYDVFGQPAIYGPDNQVRQASLYSNRFLFTGREYNANFGFYEYRARAYHPSLGRFMSEDPKLFVRRAALAQAAGDWSFAAHPEEAEFNLFRYCGNDPVDFTDPMGLDYVLLNDSEAAFGHGHNAVVVGNDRDGWTYYLKDGKSGSTMKTFSKLAEFQKDEVSKRYDRGIRIATTPEKDKAMRDFGNKNYDKKYDVQRENCADLTAEVGRRGGIDIDKPKKGGLIYRHATDPNKQYLRLKEKYKDQAMPVKPQPDKQSE